MATCLNAAGSGSSFPPPHAVAANGIGWRSVCVLGSQFTLALVIFNSPAPQISHFVAMWHHGTGYNQFCTTLQLLRHCWILILAITASDSTD